MSRLRSNSAISEEDGGDESGPHPVEPRARVAILPPVLTKAVDADPLCWLEFTEDSIMTSCKSGTLGDANLSLPVPVLFSADNILHQVTYGRGTARLTLRRRRAR